MRLSGLKLITRAKQMELWSKAAAALPENLGWVPNTLYSDSQPPITPVTGDLIPSSGFHGYSYTCAQIHTCRQK